jgi:hypothetical protein
MLTIAPMATPVAALTGTNARQDKPHTGVAPSTNVVIALILHSAPTIPI